jgi:drug/metabolite transporter (DMT)-like permease
LIDPSSVVAWVLLSGLVLTLPWAVATGVPSRLWGHPGIWLAISAATNIGGLLLAYRALRVGQVAMVAPIISTEGAIAALLALDTGESVGAPVLACLLVVAVGVFLSATSGEGGAGGLAWRPQQLAPVKFALLAACAFGVSLYATARAGSQLPVAWIAVSARLLGVLVVALPLAVAGRLRLTAQALPLVLVSGACEVVGYYSYTLGSRHGIAIASVLASQFAPLAAIGSYFAFKERLTRVQLTGIVLVVVGVATLSGLQA